MVHKFFLFVIITIHEYKMFVSSAGVFDCIAKTWSIYTDKSAFNEPIVVLPLHIEEKIERNYL